MTGISGIISDTQKLGRWVMECLAFVEPVGLITTSGRFKKQRKNHREKIAARLVTLFTINDTGAIAQNRYSEK